MTRYTQKTQTTSQKKSTIKWMMILMAAFALIFVSDHITVDAQQTCTDPATGRPVPCPPDEDEEEPEAPMDSSVEDLDFTSALETASARAGAGHDFLLGSRGNDFYMRVEGMIEDAEWQDAIRLIQGLIGAASTAALEAQFIVNFMPTLRTALANDEDPNVVEQREELEEDLDRVEEAASEAFLMLSSCEAKAFELLNELQLQDAEAAQNLLEALLRRCTLGEAWLDQAAKNVDSSSAKILEAVANGNSEPEEYDFAEFVEETERDSRAFEVTVTIENTGSTSDDATTTYDEIRENLRKLNIDAALDAFRFIESRAKYWRARFKFRVAVAKAVHNSPRIDLFVSGLQSTADAFEECGNAVQTRGLDTRLVVSNIGSSSEVLDELADICQAGPRWLAWMIDQANEFDRRSQLPEDERLPIEIEVSCNTSSAKMDVQPQRRPAYKQATQPVGYSVDIEFLSTNIAASHRIIIILTDGQPIPVESTADPDTESDIAIDVSGDDAFDGAVPAQIRIEFFDDAGNLIFVAYAVMPTCG